MRLALLLLPASLTLVLAACGGTSLPLDDAGTDASADASADAKSDVLGGDGGTCVPAPVEGTACVPGQVPCDKVIGCCSPMYGCNATTKKWELLAVGCACMSFPCGTTTCMGNEVCRKQYGGVPLPEGGVSVSYSCVPYPTACARQQTCDCLLASPPPGCTPQPAPNGCVGTPSGNTVSCMGQ